MIDWTGLEDGERCVVEEERGTKKDSWVSAARIKGGGWCHFLGLVPNSDWAERLCPGCKACSLVGDWSSFSLSIKFDRKVPVLTMVWGPGVPGTKM